MEPMSTRLGSVTNPRSSGASRWGYMAAGVSGAEDSRGWFDSGRLACPQPQVARRRPGVERMLARDEIHPPGHVVKRVAALLIATMMCSAAHGAEPRKTLRL